MSEQVAAELSSVFLLTGPGCVLSLWVELAENATPCWVPQTGHREDWRIYVGAAQEWFLGKQGSSREKKGCNGIHFYTIAVVK